jgi:Zn-dependent membrane protease YugP
MFFGFDPIYFLFLAPGLLLALWAQVRIQAAYHEGSRYRSSSGITGAHAAAEVMRAEGISNVAIEPVSGRLTDHYDPAHKVLRLSEGVYASPSLAALGVAAHEAGHALQDAHHYAPLVIRGVMVPVAGFGSGAAWIIFALGLVLRSFGLVMAGIALFSAVVLFQLVNLPVEFDASARARRALLATGLIRPEEEPVVARVLNAAAWTYVAATLTSILTLLYFLFRAGLLGGRKHED